jgi:hypothetical protein
MRAIGKWDDKYCSVEFEIDHLHIRPVSAPPIHHDAATFTSSTSTPKFFDSNQATQHEAYRDQFRLVALPMRALPPH